MGNKPGKQDGKGGAKDKKKALTPQTSFRTAVGELEAQPMRHNALSKGHVASKSMRRQSVLPSKSAREKEVKQRKASLQSKACLATLTGHTDWVNAVSIYGTALISTGWDKTVRVWAGEDSTWAEVTKFEAHDDWVTCITVCGGYLCTGSVDSTVKVWQSNEGGDEWTVAWSLEGHGDWVTVLCDCDGFLASGGTDAVIKLWDTSKDWKCAHTLTGHDGTVYGITMVQGRFLVTCGTDQVARVWDREVHWEQVQELVGHTDCVYSCAAASPTALADGATPGLLATGSWDMTVRLWDTAAWHCLRTLTGHTDWIVGLSWTAGGRLVSASTDSSLRVWNIESGECEDNLTGHTDRVNGVATHGKYLFSCSTDQTVKVWLLKEDVASGDDGAAAAAGADAPAAPEDAPPAAAPAAGASAYEEVVDESSGATYYVNTRTGSSRWTKPEPNTPTKASVWQKLYDEGSETWYYFNRKTFESAWDRPDDYESDSDNGPVPRAGEDAAAEGGAEVDLEGVEVTEVESSDDEELDAADSDAYLVKLLSHFWSAVLESDEQLAAHGVGALDTEAEPPALFGAIRSGVAVCKLINFVAPETVDERVIASAALRVHSEGGEAEDVKTASMANLTLALNAAKAINCTVGHLSAAQLFAGDALACTSFIWQVLHAQVTRGLNIKSKPSLLKVFAGDHELHNLLQLSPEDCLREWVNYHLREGGSTNTLRKFAQPTSPSVYVDLVRQLFGEDAADLPTSAASAETGTKKKHVVATMFAVALECGVWPWMEARALLSADPRLHIAFCAMLYQLAPNLGEGGDESGALAEIQMAEVAAELEALLKAESDNAAETQEQRTFLLWINSMALEGVNVQDLVTDLKDGVILLKVLDHISPGCVNWKKVSAKPKNRHVMVQNCNMIMTLTNDALGIKLVGIGGLDVLDGNGKLISALLWQLMRYHLVSMLSSISGDVSTAVEESDIIDWANTQVESVGGTYKIKNFQDAGIASGVFLLYLMHSIDGYVIDWEAVSNGESADERIDNAKYVISVAQRLGAAVFCTWQDIVQVRPKMILYLIASIMVIWRSYGGGAATGAAGAGAAE